MESEKESENIKELLSKLIPQPCASENNLVSTDLDQPSLQNKENFLKRHKSEELCGNSLAKGNSRNKIYNSKQSLPKLGSSSTKRKFRARRASRKNKKPKYVKKPSISGALEFNRSQDLAVLKEETVLEKIIYNLKSRFGEWRSSTSEKVRIFLVQIVMDVFKVTQKHWILGKYISYSNKNFKW